MGIFQVLFKDSETTASFVGQFFYVLQILLAFIESLIS